MPESLDVQRVPLSQVREFAFRIACVWILLWRVIVDGWHCIQIIGDPGRWLVDGPQNFRGILGCGVTFPENYMD